jgi:hypothetical protein
LKLYLAARDATLTAAQRYGALEVSFAILQRLCNDAPDDSHLLSFTRVARDSGRIGLAIATATRLEQRMVKAGALTLTQPFLALTERSESVEPAGPLENWLAAMLLEFLEVASAYSSLFNDHSPRRLNEIDRLGCMSWELERRRQLVWSRRGMGPPPRPTATLAAAARTSPNAAFWRAKLAL